jgi:hypothetical protein
VVVVENGVERQQCASTLKDVTIVDLRDAWTPRLFAPGADGKAPDFRATYLAIASEADKQSFELYGILPSLAVVRDRFSQVARYRCHAAIDSTPMAKITKPLGQEHDGLVKLGEQVRRTLVRSSTRAREAPSRRSPTSQRIASSVRSARSGNRPTISTRASSRHRSTSRATAT